MRPTLLKDSFSCKRWLRVRGPPPKRSPKSRLCLRVLLAALLRGKNIYSSKGALTLTLFLVFSVCWRTGNRCTVPCGGEGRLLGSLRTPELLAPQYSVKCI